MNLFNRIIKLLRDKSPNIKDINTIENYPNPYVFKHKNKWYILEADLAPKNKCIITKDIINIAKNYIDNINSWSVASNDGIGSNFSISVYRNKLGQRTYPEIKGFKREYLHYFTHICYEDFLYNNKPLYTIMIP